MEEIVNKMSTDKEKPICCHCGKQFTTTSNMYQHIREVHGVEPVNFGRLKCPGCGYNFPNYESIRNHVTLQHNVKCELEEHRFSTEAAIHTVTDGALIKRLKCHFKWNLQPCVFYLLHIITKTTFYYGFVFCLYGPQCSLAFFERTLTKAYDTDFYEWKHKIEEERKCLYIRQSAPRIISSKKKVYYFICHRSGHHKSRSTGQKRLKVASSKMNAHCPSTMMVRVSKRVSALFCPTHYGHDAMTGKERKYTKDKGSLDKKDRINEGSKSSLQKILDAVQHGSEELELIQQLTKNCSECQKRLNIT
ncbi:uncharacterized protein CEXT_556791 [Caerostris extrusa]|uniref:C2H2-type domain-containing protein n=1 Tax=Caerostris extrusa TaxID=172846 RepID=A0AAV4S996_CAEEX|nr:uncharacterized protein CEXT_556791 [Caerostris extrusa]